MQLHLCRYRGFFAQGQAYQDFAGRAVPAAVGGSGSRLGIWGGGKRDPRFSKGLTAPSGYPRLAGRWRRFHKTKSIDTNCQIAFQALGTDWLPWGRARKKNKAPPLGIFAAERTLPSETTTTRTLAAAPGDYRKVRMTLSTKLFVNPLDPPSAIWHTHAIWHMWHLLVTQDSAAATPSGSVASPGDLSTLLAQT